VVPVSKSYSQEAYDSQHIQVSLRMIGHQILLNAGDSTSRVLPIKNEAGKYRIEFESDFGFNPDELVTSIDNIFSTTDIADGYILEVEQCQSNQIVYSYEIWQMAEKDIIPCAQRDQPKSCYSLLFTLIGETQNSASGSNSTPNTLSSLISSGSLMSFAAFGLFILLLVGIIYFIRDRKKSPEVLSSLIPIGAYTFDKTNTKLMHEEQSTELTSKEADLLLLLYNAVNTIVEREVMLEQVWGDEGDYIGRTVDVFISKLRKKLEFDSNIKIVNIRGVGYKLVLNT